MNGENIKSVIEDWLTKVPEALCFTEKMKIYAPTCRGKCEREVDILIDKMNHIFGGSTTYNKATGCWYDSSKEEIICEPTRVIEIGHNCSTKLKLEEAMKAITQYAVDSDQDAISIQNGKFYIAEREPLLTKYEELREEVKAPPMAAIS